MEHVRAEQGMRMCRTVAQLAFFPPPLTGVEQFTVKDDQVAGAVLVIPGLGLKVFFVARREPLWSEKKRG
jgi:hypothetical protein